VIHRRRPITGSVAVNVSPHSFSGLWSDAPVRFSFFFQKYLVPVGPFKTIRSPGRLFLLPSVRPNRYEPSSFLLLPPSNPRLRIATFPHMDAPTPSPLYIPHFSSAIGVHHSLSESLSCIFLGASSKLILSLLLLIFSVRLSDVSFHRLHYPVVPPF